jgi:hypothetical protein
MVPTYPTGFSLFILALSPLTGWRHAGDAAAVLSSVAGLLATYGLGRSLGLGRGWAVLGAALVAASPLYLLMSVTAMSDVPSLVWTTLAVLAALKCRESPRWALAAGAALAVDVLLRPTNVLALVPVAVALGADGRRAVLFVIGGLPGAVFLAAHSMAAYGSIIATGYGDASESFGARYVAPSLLHCAIWLPALFTPVVALSVGLPWLASVRIRSKWLLGTWILAFAAFYSAYKCTHETWWYLRFLLPAVPAIAVGSLLVLRELCARVSGRALSDIGPLALSGALLVVAGGSVGVSHHLHPLYVAKMEHQYVRLTEWMEVNIPADAVCVTMQASGAIFYYTDFRLIRWDFVDPENVGRIEAAIRLSRRPLYAVLFPFEYNDAHVLDKRMPGHWDQVGRVGDVLIVRRDFDAAKS